MPPKLSSSDWIRRFAAQGMTRDEIMSMLGVSRFRVNNALNRELSAGNDNAVKRTDAEQCGKCGALLFEQQPSRIGHGRHCGSCGAHYRYWANRRVERKRRNALVQLRKPSQSERLADARVWLEANRQPETTPKPRSAFFIYAIDSFERTIHFDCSDDPLPVLEPETAPPVTPIVTPTVERPETPRRRELSLREAFEECAPRTTRKLQQKALDEAADEWLRKHERSQASVRVHEDQPPLEVIADIGVRNWGVRKDGEIQHGKDSTNWRAELRAQAASGDEYAQWRCWELFDAPD